MVQPNEQVRDYLSQARDALSAALKAAAGRFPSVDRLLALLDRRCAAALQDRGRFRQFNEAHNEACAAIELLKSPVVGSIDYEPSIEGTEKRLDFLVLLEDGRQGWVEVKTINPRDQDDWEKYQGALDEARFPKNVNVILAKGMMGGEIYHDAYAARTKLLEHTLETEARIAAGGIDPATTPCTLAIAASPLKFSRDELEDFTAFYRSGKHSSWDEWRDMEAHFIEQQGIRFAQSIATFSYIGRATFEVWPREVNWNVQFPTEWSDVP